jgi:hypothetical protein
MFKLAARGQETRLDVAQANIPEDLQADLKAGWVE